MVVKIYPFCCRFFKLTGTLFGFVAKDIEWKVSVIESKLKSSRSQHYRTVKKMVQYEVNNSMALKKGHDPSGSRTLLRLHWALEFILEFMSRISESTDVDKTSAIASDVYVKTLSNHHPWVTRKMATLAMYFLPSRKELISVMCKQDYTTVLELLHHVVEAGQVVYDTTEKVYAQNNLLRIP